MAKYIREPFLLSVNTKNSTITIEKPAFEWWTKIEGFNTYSVSSLGRVRNDKSGDFLQPLKRPDNRLYVDLYSSLMHKKKSIARLVALAFHPNPCKKPQVNHLNSDVSINWTSNLEWATSSENNIHANRIGNKLKHAPNKGRFSNDSFNSKAVIAELNTGEILHFHSALDASKSLGICYRNLTQAARDRAYMPRKKVLLYYSSK